MVKLCHRPPGGGGGHITALDVMEDKKGAVNSVCLLSCEEQPVASPFSVSHAFEGTCM